jgi:predicted nucleic acid-binding protein
MLVVSDTSTLTALLQIGKDGLLAVLFGRVFIGELESRAGFFVSEMVKQIILAAADEAI